MIAWITQPGTAGGGCNHLHPLFGGGLPGPAASHLAEINFRHLPVLHPSPSTSVMKSKRKPQNGHVNGSELVPVRFEFAHPTAATVCVAGSFNQWKPARTLHPKGRGRWSTETELPPGTYEYCLVVDGQWMPDPQAPATVPNPFGGRNSILEVKGGPHADVPVKAEHRPATNGK